MNKTVYLVKFDRGYYAANQSNYYWSYTDNITLAQSYSSIKKAKERGELGVNLIDGKHDSKTPKTYKIEKYTVKTVMEFIEEIGE